MATADAASELLIARLLEQDLENLRSAREAERLQLDLATAATQLAAGRIPKNTYTRNAPSPSDSEIALVVEDEDMIESSMDGEPYQAGRFAATLRRKLYRGTSPSHFLMHRS